MAVIFAALLAFISVAWSASVLAAQTSIVSATLAEARWRFDLPVQPVEEALYRLSAITGAQIFADGQIVAGRQAKALSGDFTTQEALDLLLSGTGLVARSVERGSIMVTLGLTGAEAETVRRNYSTALQRAVLTALCRDGEPSLGAYRLALRMWLSGLGRVERIDLLSSTGDTERDRRIGGILRGVIAEPPPTALPQPIIMVILPRSPQNSGDCTARPSPGMLP